MAGSLIKIAETIVSGTPSTVQLLGIDSTYDVYKCVVSGVTSTTDDKDFKVRVTASGTAKTTSDYDEATKNLRTDTTFSNSSIANNDRFQPFSALGSDTGENGNLTMYLFNFNNASEFSFITIESSYFNASTNGLFGHQGGGVYTVAEAHNGLEFFLESSDTFESGTFTLYALKK